MAIWHDGGGHMVAACHATVQLQGGQRHGLSSYEAHGDVAYAAVREAENGPCSCEACGDMVCAAVREALMWPVQLRGTQQRGMPGCEGGSDVASVAEREAPTQPMQLRGVRRCCVAVRGVMQHVWLQCAMGAAV